MIRLHGLTLEWGMALNCPKCGKEMEEGYMTVPLHMNLHSIKWNTDPKHHILDGDLLYDPKQHGGWTKMSVGLPIAASRRRECRCVVFFYPTYEPDPPWPDMGSDM